METIEKIRALMAKHNINSPYALSKEIGATPNVVANWFMRGSVPAEWLLPIARKLGTTTDFLLDPSVTYLNHTPPKKIME